MAFQTIENLIKKYENGDTNLSEEQRLKNYFSQNEVPPHLEVYKSMFLYFKIAKEEQITKNVQLKLQKTRLLYNWISVAAVAIIMVGMYWAVGNQAKTLDNLSEDELLVYNQTVQAFNLLSENFNKGKTGLNALNTMSNSLDKGVQNLAFLNEFANSTNKIFKTNRNN